MVWHVLVCLAILASAAGAFGGSNASVVQPRGWPGPNNVKTKKTWSYSGPCSPGTVYYPDSYGTFPLLSFAHGLGASGTRLTYSYTLNAVASWGYIIVALEGCEIAANEQNGQQKIMDWMFDNWDTIDHGHPGGVFGHSMGGAATDATAADGNACIHYGLQGAVMMHPGVQLGMGAPWIPSMFTSGTLDTVVGAYNEYTHFNPCGPVYNKEVYDIANWFGCFLWYNQDSCGSLASSFCNGDKASSCKLIWSNEAAGAFNFSHWDAAVASGDPHQVQAIPWGLHNGTLQGFVDEVRRRGEWAVQQRRSYILQRRQTLVSAEPKTVESDGQTIQSVGQQTQQRLGSADAAANSSSTHALDIMSGLPSIPGTDVTLDNINGHSGVKYRLTKPWDVGVGGDGPWPFLGFFHALTMKGFEINGYSTLLTEVAKKGFIIITLFDFPAIPKDKACGLVWDTLHAAQSQLGLGGYADYSRIGIFGHSMGGGETLSAAARGCDSSDNVLGAAVALHPWMAEAPAPIPSSVTCPTMYLTGTKDTNVKAADVKAAYDKCPQQKIFANGEGFNHMAPLNKPVGNERWNYYIASYFSCHLNGDGDGCKAAYVDLGNDPMLAEFDTWTPPPLAYLGDTSKCIDLPGGDTTNGNRLWLWGCNGRENQWWVFLPDSWAIAYGPDQSKCIDVPGGDLTPGNVLQIWDCNQLDNQKWGYDSEQQTIYLASSTEASVCMDLTGGDVTPGTAIEIWGCNGLPNQQWYVPPQLVSIQNHSSTVQLGLSG